MSDIVEWLRIMEDGYRSRGGSGAEDFKLAADTIERLRAELEQEEGWRQRFEDYVKDVQSAFDEKDKRIEDLEAEIQSMVEDAAGIDI